MGNVFTCSGDAIASLCWKECIREPAMYMCKLEENLDALEKALNELQAKRGDVVHRVNVAEQQQQLKQLQEVELWCNRVRDVKTEVDELIKNRPQEIQRLCLGGYCSKNCKFTYKFGKRVAQKLKDVNDLKNKDFAKVAEEQGAPPMRLIPIEPAVVLDSPFKEVWSRLQDENMGIIGLHGIGGVGKTTLLTQINNKFHPTSNDFDVVIWVVASKDLQLEKVQEDIGKSIGFSVDSWKGKRFDEKARDICNALTSKKFVLLLDDLWEWIDLTKVGIPLQNIQKGSKIVFTTRSEEVCYQMNAKRIKVECLAWEKAWELFQEKVGKETLSSHPDIPNLAEIMTKKCGGLPLALVIIGRAMASKRRPQQWKDAIKDLATISGMEKEVLHLLKFSYDNLGDDKVKSCFRYCALFPEDFLIYKADLIDYWIGEGFLDGYDDRGKAKSKGEDIIDILLQASLLEDEGNCVKMHDVIRELALWIAKECGKVKDKYLVEASAQLIKTPDVEKWERARRVSLMTNRIENLTETPKCPNLLTLFLHDNRLKMIASEFFQFMPSLRVLNLSRNNDLKELPLGISKLVSLEYLNLSWTGIQQLSDELKTLVKLKYLNLEYTLQLNRIQRQLISSFSKLEVLRMYGCGTLSEVEESILSKGNNELLVDELLFCNHLSTLTINIKSDSALQRFLSFQKLQSCTQKLLVCCLSSLEQLNVSSLANMKLLEELDIEKCESLQELKIEWASEGREIQVLNNLHKSFIQSERCFNSLCKVEISYCPKLRDLTWLILAPNLTFLLVISCCKLEKLISVGKLGEVLEVEGNLIPFAKLEVLMLQQLPELKSIYRSALPFPHLKKIGVLDCPKLKKLPLNSNSAMERKIIIQGQESWWKELEWEDEATQKAFIPCFENGRILFF